MKKLLVVLLVMSMAMFAFANITASGPNFTTSVRGWAHFGLIFDEDGLDLYVGQGAQHQAFWTMSVTVTAEAVDGDAKITFNFLPSLTQGWSDWRALPFNWARYEDNMFNLFFANYGYGNNFSSNFLANWFAPNGARLSTPIGHRYLNTTFKDLGFDVLYITLNDYDNSKRHDNDSRSSLFAADIFAVNYPVDYASGSGNVAAALWFSGTDDDPFTRDNVVLDELTTDGEYFGFGVETNWAGKELFDGLSLTLMYGMHDEMAHRVLVNYRKGYPLNDMITLTPHSQFQKREGVAEFMPFSDPSLTDTFYVQGGLDVGFNFGELGTANLYDTIKYDFDSEDLTYLYGVNYTNTMIDLANFYVNFRKNNGTEVADPFALNVKLNGALTEDMFDFAYLVELAQTGPDRLVLLEDLGDLLDGYLAYKVTVGVNPMDKVRAEANVFNFRMEPWGRWYGNIEPIADFSYTLDVTYKPNSIVTLGAHLGNEDNWGEYDEIHWFLFAQFGFAF